MTNLFISELNSMMSNDDKTPINVFEQDTFDMGSVIGKIL